MLPITGRIDFLLTLPQVMISAIYRRCQGFEPNCLDEVTSFVQDGIYCWRLYFWIPIFLPLLEVEWVNPITLATGLTC